MGLLGVWPLYCHTLSAHGSCSCGLSDRYFGLDGCHGGRFLVAGLCY